MSFLEISLRFPYASCLLFTGSSRNGLLSVHALKSLISTNGMQYLLKESLVGLPLPFLNEGTNNLIIFLNVASIR